MPILERIVTPKMPRGNKAVYHVLITDDIGTPEEPELVTVIDKDYSVYMVKGDNTVAEANVMSLANADIAEYLKNKKKFNQASYQGAKSRIEAGITEGDE
jgi:hypothetical protein